MAFAPVVDTARKVSSTAFALQDRQDSACTQTVEQPIWYGVDYNTCSMQTTTAPCSVSFPTISCHTARPSPLRESYGMPALTKLWIVIGITIFLTIIIPVIILWARWKLSAPRRGGKRSISIQLEKDEDSKPSKATSGSSSTPKTGSKASSSQNNGSKRVSQAPNGDANILDRLVGSKRYSHGKNRAPTHYDAGDIRVINNININGGLSNHHQPLASPTMHTDEPPLMSPRIALESLPLNHPARLPGNQPWTHQDQSGRWVPREEGYLHPGIPTPPHLRNGRADVGFIDQEGDARGGGFYVPGAWHQ